MQYKKSLIVVFAFIVFLLSAFNVRAQETRTLTLKEAIELSIRNSKQLQLSKAKIDEAVAATKEATQKRIPDVSVSTNYLRLGNANVKMHNGDSAAKTPFNINEAIYGTANISYPVFTGFKMKFGIESAKYLEKAAMLDADGDKQEVILNTISAYLNLYKANIAARLVEEDLLQSRQRDTDFVNLEKNGLLARNDLLKAQLQTSQFELGLLDAQNAIQLAHNLY
jgi:outer membrane protein